MGEVAGFVEGNDYLHIGTEDHEDFAEHHGLCGEVVTGYCYNLPLDNELPAQLAKINRPLCPKCLKALDRIFAGYSRETGFPGEGEEEAS